MNESEYNHTTDRQFAPGKRFKYLGTKDFVMGRVLDGNFNNSRFINKYTHLVKVILNGSPENIHKLGKREVIIDIRSTPLLDIQIEKLGLIKKEY